MQAEELKSLAVEALEDLKGIEIEVLDVRGKTSIADFMVVATGTSSRHVKSLADNVALKAKQGGVPPLGVEGEQGSDWVLIDLVDVLVHVMLREARDFYNIEKLWSVDAEKILAQREAADEEE
ncbi:ribosome silencing factor [Solemya pervernicosa gill symbiont]|uniref:Ribosomal silencing factor RsfS n=2 Tax=Gammaproteobacteria incertae sedis TaxID=118884 RepID=A0A1T2L713_9GAMM|nr:ribosome silencing factor [Candidatus Reidiella endopervernicosa]OOZ40897.1 ribosome silencing factor [Solemya pervernicosa gill symbiont]QKQ26127.1 ribosome silencing factor [Candidatus Reidiella endopervernicosa]